MTMLERYQLKVRKIALAEGEQIGLERGLERGLEKGEKRGLERGEKRGLEKGNKKGHNLFIIEAGRFVPGARNEETPSSDFGKT